jgi:hypothetical protein
MILSDRAPDDPDRPRARTDRYGHRIAPARALQDTWQLAPLLLIALALVVLAAHAVLRRAASMIAIRLVMVLSVASGAIGVGLHYKGNTEFEREMYPSIEGFELFSKSMTGATPALAPGTMTLLGLIGLIYTYRHPSLYRGGRDYYE